MIAAESLLPMRWWHLDEVIDLEQRIFEATAWSREQFYAELANPDRWLQVLHDSHGHLVGYVDVAVADRVADLMTIVVAPSGRGKGVGTRLLSAAMAHARDRGAQQMLLEVRADNPAQQLYRSCGFTEIDVRRRYYADGADAVIMRAVLETKEAHLDGQ
jgi:[ribosomal protein S18]-alanine N-acetyltransferase